jgi:hypothetical protein
MNQPPTPQPRPKREKHSSKQSGESPLGASVDPSAPDFELGPTDPGSPLLLLVTQWMPILVQVFGLSLIGYEAAIAVDKSAAVVAAGLALAIGGKLSDILRTGGL